jgi:hypothetical protein
MKTGRPEYYLPSPSTVSRDVRMVFARSRQRIAAMLRVSTGMVLVAYWLITHQKHDGKLHFATDAWTSPNHRAYVAVTVHFEHAGEPVCLILDVVEVAKVSPYGLLHEDSYTHFIMYIVAQRSQSCAGVLRNSKGVWH